ncbi:unnamed protein product [Didymodactylos carnosus]|uniref:Glucuronosyltransferase n=1 Tax=Didymodactylos carnosus TaxID=1234261 RepID=A0A814XQA4_9BILA|nr:unnamed protein product [Didymodactylos carnosus]CAF1218201.1 unnamed protein product [Didymodactylos carnosus]CAF3827663.1 unnamed protein product [Didymodactylos carnosus]CAF3981761.1 unnamed protein product [Didymodactylos carnosus]
MTSVVILFLWLPMFIPQSFGFNALMISIGAAGHVIPMFELAKAMKNHNVTFITEPLAQSYINFKSYSNLSSFHLILTNDSSDVFNDHKKMEKEIVEYFINHSLFDSTSYMMPIVGASVNALMSKAVHMLMLERFDVIIGSSLVIGLHALCKEANTSCVTQIAEIMPNIFDINLPNSYSFLSSKQVTEFKYRIYNVAFSVRFITKYLKKWIESFFIIFHSFPQIPGPFYETFTLKNILRKPKFLQLISVPPTLYPPSYSHHCIKYLGGFVDESSIDYIDNDFTRWIKSKAINSIVYASFGSTGLIKFDRMKNLINGLAEFLIQTHDASALLAFRNTNYDTYQIVLNEMKNDEYRRILLDDQRVKVENGFVQQKWILQQNSVYLYISHCGMGSSVEGLYFQKPILCLPLHTDQFANAITIDYSGVGQSLFLLPSPLQSFLNPIDFHDYIFSASSVTIKLATMWRNSTYEKAVRIMSAEMKHAGGVRRAVEEIEFLVNLNGNLDRYAPFQSTLPFYQRYMLDLVIVYIVLPLVINVCLFFKCRNRNRKKKID